MDLITKDKADYLSQPNSSFMVMPEGCWPVSKLGNPKSAQVIHPGFFPLLGTYIKDYEAKYKNR